MADFIAQDGVENPGAFIVATSFQFALDRWRNIQPSGFEEARDQCHTHQNIVGGLFGHFPKPGVSGKVAIVVPNRA